MGSIRFLYTNCIYGANYLSFVALQKSICILVMVLRFFVLYAFCRISVFDHSIVWAWVMMSGGKRNKSRNRKNRSLVI